MNSLYKLTLSVFLGLFPATQLLQAQDNPVAAALGYPDMIVYNGKIVTMDDVSFSSDPGTIVQAMAIRNDEILALGTNQQIRALAGPATQQIDLRGRTVLPSFILTHEHPTDWAWTEPTGLNHVFPEGNEHMVIRFLKGTPDEQIANWEAVLKEAVSIARPGQWILLSSDWGGNFEHMAGLVANFYRHVTTARMDELAPDNPVRVKNAFVDGIVNTRGRQEATKVFGEYTARGNRGPTGRMLEPDVMLHGKVELNAELLKAQMELWAAHGVTAYGSSPYTLANMMALNILDQQGRMPGRFGWAYTGPNEEYFTLAHISSLLGNGTDHLWNIGAHGEWSAGDCTTLSASERVKQQESCSIEPGHEGRRVKEDIVRSGGRIAAMHSGGDKDIDYLLDVIEEQSAAAGLSLEQVHSRRHAFDHASGAPRPEQIPRIKRLGMMISMINTVLWENRTGYNVSYRVRNYGEEYAHYAVPRQSVTKAGIMSTQEIDRALPHFLFYNTWVGMTRYNEGCQRAFAPEEGTDLITQLKGLTSWGAYYLLREDRIGTLEKGKLADFVVLDRDVLTIPIDDIPQVKVLMTVLGGKTIHLLQGLASEFSMSPVGASTWPSRPLETRYVLKGPAVGDCPALN
jgi:predicted amidohydrolase YtcJ